MALDPRICKRCGGSYPPGGYADHSVVHSAKEAAGRIGTKTWTRNSVITQLVLQERRTLQEVGDQFGISRQRVAMIVAQQTGKR